jgi:hypothetical protein
MGFGWQLGWRLHGACGGIIWVSGIQITWVFIRVL